MAAHCGKWRSPKGRAHALAIVVLLRKEDRAARTVGPSRRAHFFGVWSKTPNSMPHRLAIGCFQGNQYVTLLSTVLFRAIAFQQTVLPPSRVLILYAIARRSLKMNDFSKTGSRNMAETRAINFLTLFWYSTSIVIGGLRRLLLPILMWAGVDFEYFWAETTWCSFRGFFQIWSPMEQKLEERELWFLEMWENAERCIKLIKKSAYVDALRR